MKINDIRKCFILIVLIFSDISSYAGENCSQGKHWVSSYFRRAYNRHDGTFVKASKVSAYCRINPRGYKKWHQRISTKRPKIWKYHREKSKKWSVEEVERLFDAISVLPNLLINSKKVYLFRMNKSEHPSNPATSNYGDIVLYDRAFTHSDSLSQILSHELSHVLYKSLSDIEKDKFKMAAQWVAIDYKGKKSYVPLNGKIFIQEDSRMSIEEDFANHIEFYLFKNKFLKKKSLNAEAWIRKQFGKDFKLKGGK